MNDVYEISIDMDDWGEVSIYCGRDRRKTEAIAPKPDDLVLIRNKKLKVVKDDWLIEPVEVCLKCALNNPFCCIDLDKKTIDTLCIHTRYEIYQVHYEEVNE